MKIQLTQNQAIVILLIMLIIGQAALIITIMTARYAYKLNKQIETLQEQVQRYQQENKELQQATVPQELQSQPLQIKGLGTAIGQYTLTFYCPCHKCVGKKTIIRTASGTKPIHLRTIAVDKNKIPLGSIVYIEGHGIFIAEDTGSAIKGNRIDIFVKDHNEALSRGKQKANVYLLKRGY